MNIFSYDVDGDHLTLNGICDEWFEVLWKRRFFKGDEFTITLPPTPQNVALFSEEKVIELGKVNPLTGASEHSGVVTSVSISSGERSVLTVSGKSVDGLLERRVFSELGDSIIEVLRRNAGDLARANRQFGAVHFDVDSNVGIKYLRSMRWKTLSELVSYAGEQVGWGLQTYIDHSDAPHIIISGRVYADRSVSQSENKRVIFSDEYENATDFEKQHTETGAVSAVVVGANAKYSNVSLIDIAEVLDYFDNGASGFGRIEKFQAANVVTEGEVRGDDVWTVLDVLGTYAESEKIATATYVPTTDFFGAKVIIKDGWETKFNLGDIVTVQNTEWSVTANKQVTEIQEYWGADDITVTATLGNPPKTLTEILKKG